MNVFMTNASGYVGSAVANALRQNGHQISALARNESSAATLQAAGITPVRAELRALEHQQAAITAADTIIHTAFEYFPDGRENADLDRQTVLNLLAAMGRQRPQQLIYTSNAYLPQIQTEAPVIALHQPSADEQARAWRLQVEQQVLHATSTSLATAVLRLGMVYGGQGGGTISDLMATAKHLGYLPYPETLADNHWSLIARPDLAALYRTIAEQRGTGVFHGVDGHPMTVAAVCECVARHVGVPVKACTPNEARTLLSAHAWAVMQRQVALTCARSQSLGWRPDYPNLATGIQLSHG